MSFRIATILVVMAFLAGCGAHTPLPPPPVAQPPLLDANSACLQDLAAAHVVFQPLAGYGEGNCSIANPVKLTGGTVPWNHAGILSCPMARTIVHFETDVIQPLAQRYFHQRVQRLLHFGTYDCRAQRNETSEAAARMGSSKGGRLSEHAKGRAIDLAGFELADGSKITVKQFWYSSGPEANFLHELARASCQSFNVVLTPNHDRLHQDHMHLDIGPHTLCGI